MPKLILCRHGQGEWNARNLFTGWADVRLSKQGIERAQSAGRKVYDNQIEVGIAFISLFTRILGTTRYTLASPDQQ